MSVTPNQTAAIELELNPQLESEKLNRSLMEHIILGVAHEINNPNSFVRMNAMTLKKMIGMISRCLDEYSDAHPEEKFGPYSLLELRSKMIQLTESILEASVRIIAVADKLKQCSSFALSTASEISVLSIIRNVIDMHRFIIDKSANVTLDHKPDSIYAIRGFSLQLEQGFSILITNACDAIAERYRDANEKFGDLKISLIEDDETVTLHFEDNGTGIDPETQKKIFTPYFTTKPQGVGDGLGLPLCLAIVDRHGGKMSVKSEKGSGTVFTVVLLKNLGKK